MNLLVGLLYLIMATVLVILIRLFTKGNVVNFFKEPIALALVMLVMIHGSCYLLASRYQIVDILGK